MLSTAVTPAHWGLGAAQQPPADPAQPPTPRHVAMSWARRIIASIEEPEVIGKILSQLERTAPQQYSTELPLGARAPPVPSSLL